MTDRELQRTEAFSDGVFAIAITLLVLELRVPVLEEEFVGNVHLRESLTRLWPSFIAFGMSFWVILVMWINHHDLLYLARRSDRQMMFANGVLLLMVTFVPFPTAVLARYLGTPARDMACALYCGTFVLISVSYCVLFYTIWWNKRLARADVSHDVYRRVEKAYLWGLAVYGAAFAMTFVSGLIGLAICTSLWFVWTRLAYTSARAQETPNPHRSTAVAEEPPPPKTPANP